MDRAELEDILSKAKIDAKGNPFNREAFENGPKGFDVLLAEACDNLNEITLCVGDDGCPTKISQHVLVFTLWKDQLLSEKQRKLPDGTIITVKAEGQLISETARKREPHGVTAWFGIIEELAKPLRNAGITVTAGELKFLGAGRTQKPRPSTVYVGWRAQRIIYRAVWDLSHRKEQPWETGLEFDDLGTVISAAWSPATPEFLDEIVKYNAAVGLPTNTETRYVGS